MEKLHVTSNFSISHSVFERLVLQTRKNQGLFGKGLMIQWLTPFENIVRKEKKPTGYQHLLHFSQWFLFYEKNLSSFIISFKNPCRWLILNESKICPFFNVQFISLI